MLPGLLPLLAAEASAESTVFWRGVLVVVGLLTLLAVWGVLRRRWARRSLDSWAGQGVHPGLDPLGAGILLRVHPTRLLAVALEPLLADGHVQIESSEPLRLVWSNRAPRNASEEALSRAIDAEGALDESSFFEWLEVVHRGTEAAMAPFSGRATALHHRGHVARLWARAARRDAVPPEDRCWLLLHDPGNRAHRIPTGPAGEVLHDLIRLARLFRRHGPGARAIADRAHGAKTGYFRRRRDLDLVRIRRGERPDWDRTEAIPESPVQRKLITLAASLDGEVSLAEPNRPFLLHYARVSPRVTGRYRGRVATVTLGPEGEMVAALTCSAACLFRITPSAGAGPVGTASFRETIDVHATNCPELGDWLELPRMQDLVVSLSPFVALEGHATRLELTIAYDRDRFETTEILDRYESLLTLGEYFEERLVASGARGPGGTR